MSNAIAIADLVANPAFVQNVLEPTPESDAFWKDWVDQDPGRKEIFKEACLVVLMMESSDYELEKSKKEALWNAIEEKTYLSTRPSRPPVSRKSKPVRRPTFRKMKIAAALFVVTSMISIFLYTQYNDSRLVVVENRSGQKSDFTLPDGTRVWLNGASKLVYKSSFDKIREVTLEGEAFFDVVEDKTKPFVVNASKIVIKVLGTAFNVKSYQEEKTIETTLVRGKVLIEIAESKKGPIVLAEKQQAVYSKESRQVQLSAIQTDRVTSWTTGKLIFNNETFSEVKKKLERYYGVHILLSDERNLSCHYSATIDNVPLLKVLELFKETGDVTYEFKSEDTLIINGRLCTD